MTIIDLSKRKPEKEPDNETLSSRFTKSLSSSTYIPSSVEEHAKRSVG